MIHDQHIKYDLANKIMIIITFRGTRADFAKVATDDHQSSIIIIAKHCINLSTLIKLIIYQGLEASSSSCNGCDCPMTIRLNPAKASNTTVITSPRNCDEDSYVMINDDDGL